MARYLFTVWSFPGHINPNLAVAEALRSRGHEVAFYTGERGAGTLAELGITHFPMRRVDDEAAYKRHHLIENDDRVGGVTAMANWKRSMTAIRESLIDTMPDQVADLEPILADWRPDAIVCDPNLLAPFMILHETRSIPVAILSFTMACMISGRDVAPFGRGLPPPTTVPRRLRANMENAIGRRMIRPLRRRVGVLRVQHGLPPTDRWFLDLGGAMPLYLVTSVPELDYERRDLPSSVQYVGRVAWDRPNTLPQPAWIGDLPTDRPLIYVTEGTVYGRQPKLLQAAARGLAALPVQVLMTVNADRDPAESGLDAPAPNVRLQPYTPGRGWQSDILPRASVVVTNGGAGSVLAALSEGVPLVVVPTVWDKPENAQRVVAAGAGLQLAPKDCTPERLRQAVQRVLDEPSFHTNARRIAAALARAGGATHAAELLEWLCGVDSANPLPVLASSGHNTTTTITTIS